jgi:hypothetical protein
MTTGKSAPRATAGPPGEQSLAPPPSDRAEPRPLVDRLRDPVPNALAELSGTRLKAKFTTGTDGSKLYEPEVLHDTQLDVDCAFGLAADGQTRCMPTLEPEAVPGFLYFADDACTQPIAVMQPPPLGCPATPPKYMLTYDPPPACPPADPRPPTHVHPFGTFRGPISGAYRKVGASCTLDTVQLNSIAYNLLAELPSSTFATGTAGIEP